MIRFSVLRVVFTCGMLCGLPAALRAQPPTVDEAMQLSQTTGRPIFAMAGNKT